MIASRSESTTNISASDKASFLRMLPVIRRHASIRFRGRGREQREEFLAEVVALAWMMYVRLLQRRRSDLAFATPLAEYSCRQVRVGRGLGHRGNVLDVTSTLCQRRKQVRVESLDQRDLITGEWRETIVEDRRARIIDRVAFLMDFPAWMRTLPRRDRRIAQMLATGEATSHVARRFRVTAGRISQLRRELHDGWQEFTADRKKATEPLVGAA